VQWDGLGFNTTNNSRGELMAGDWIKIRCGLHQDPDVIGIAAQVGLDEYATTGRLMALWAWADQNTADGHAPTVTESWLDRFLQCDGFAAAMVTVGWLEVNEGDGIRIPDFESHNGQNAKKRAQAQKRKQKQRSGHLGGPELSRQERDDGSDTQRDNGVTREEKRREDLQPPLTPPKGGSNGRGRRLTKKQQAALRGQHAPASTEPGTF
jgi:hypothetical protein